MSDHPDLDDLQRRVGQDPASIAFAQLAEEYRRLARFEEAVDTCRAGLKVHPALLSARLTLGRSLLRLGLCDDAQIELEAVLKADSQNPAAICGLAELHQQRGATALAIAHYRRALALAPHDPELERTINELSSRAAATDPHERARAQIAALEQWLAAIHGTRALRRA